MIIEKFRKIVEKFPDKISVLTGERHLTYRQLEICARRVVVEMQRIDVGEGREKPVTALLLDHNESMIVGLLAALTAGQIYVPLDNSYPCNRLDHILENSVSRMILTNHRNLPLAKVLAARGKNALKILNIDTLAGSTGFCVDILEPERSPGAETPVYILYTSGSTGKPKGVVQNHGSVLHYIRNWISHFSISSSDRLTLFSVFTHDAAVMDIYAALLSGAALYPYNIKEESNINGLASWLRDKKISIWHSVPTFFRYFSGVLLKAQQEDGELPDFPELRFVLLGGEALRMHDIRVFTQCFPNSVLANIYGQTESSLNSIWLFNPTDKTGDSLKVNRILLGDPVDETRFLIVSEGGGIVNDLGVGEIFVASRYIAPGYWQDRERTRQVFLEAPGLGRLYRSGDLGRLHSDGSIEFLGRKDFQVKIRGFRVEVEEIESCLLTHRSVKEAAIIPKEDETNNTRLCAFIVPHSQVDVLELRRHLAAQLPDYMMPSYFILLEKLPLNSTGKIDRRLLAKMEKDHLKPKRNVVVPGTETEKQIARAWQEILGLEEVSVDDNFFDLGGNSFDILKVHSILEKELMTNMPIVNLFKYSSIRSLAASLKKETWVEDFNLKQQERLGKIASGKSRLQERTRRIRN